MICQNPSCKKEIQVTEPYTILALDIPYMNIYFHPGCRIEDIDTIKDIVLEQFKQPSIKMKRNQF